MFKLEDHYRELHPLAQGGMSKVYLGIDLKLDRQVALKVIDLSSPISDKTLLEAKLLACFNHPNIVQIYKTIQHDEQLILEMEYVKGTTLECLIKQKNLTLPKKLELLLDITQGLFAIHQQNILHLDLKAANVLVNESGSAKIADFGISQIKDTFQAQENSSFGSLTAMSPEQLNEQPLDFRSDLFSLGLIAYQLFANQHPYMEQSPTPSNKSIAEQIKNSRCRADACAIADIPEPLGLLINRLLSYHVKQRPASSAEVIEELKHIMMLLNNNSETISLADIQLASKQKKWKELTVFTLLSCIAIGLFSASIWYWQANKPKTYVAVLPIEFSKKTKLLDSQKQVLNLAINDAIRQYLLDTSGYALISQIEIRQTQKLLGDNLSLPILGKALNADQLLTTHLDCTPLSCDINLSLLDGKSGTLVRAERSASDTENYMGIYNVTSNFIEKLYTGDIATKQALKKEREFLERYVSLVNVVSTNSRNTLSLIADIEDLILHSPEFTPLYPLYRKIVLRHYDETLNPEVIKKLKMTLDTLPSSYHDSPAYLIDLLEIYQHVKDKYNTDIVIGKIKKSDIEEFQKQTLLAIYYKRSGELERSLTHAKLAYKIRPMLITTRNLAIVHVMLGDNKKASEYLSKILTHIPNDFFALQTLADISLLSGNLVKAEVNYQRLITGSTAISSTYSNYSIVLSLKGELTEALYYAQKAVELSSKNSTQQLNLADILFMLGKKDQAFDIYKNIDKGIADDTQVVELLLEKAQAQVHLGKSQKAMISIDRALNQNSELSEVYFVKAMVQTILGEKYSAVASIEQSIKKGWSPVFYRLIWFKPLCTENQFKTLLGKENYNSLCT
ncbi:serine/threonine protein kinase [Pseudoalteromonas aliena]|uniref:Serine/threonine protein kinase n=1 Tax=Pseudoalteromonas aliena TaxID=247523 RepID=A0A1Q2H3Y0_9GAMM|nr:serine/threonine-protein kinase [Pseudoalteromonas aliena]AQQ02074.1 serine/threonine protein kinase [Pseudoalteromonas aliena]